MADTLPEPTRHPTQPKDATPTPAPADTGTDVGADARHDPAADPAIGSTFPPEARELLAELHLAATPEPPPPPEWHIPGYEIRGELARGGMGAVLQATDTALGREVAVKVLLDKYGPKSTAARRFVEEARIAAQLQHPGIPPVHELGALPDGRPFLAMKLIKGQTLDQLLASGGRQPPVPGQQGADAPRSPRADTPNLVATFESICQAVAFAHARHVIHRDLKPSNVMVGAFGEVQVMDWGLAKVLTVGGDQPPRPDTDSSAETATEIRSPRDSDEADTQTGSLLGTPAFMPPEQAIGDIHQIGPRSDVFGLGAVLCAILTGKPPYVGSDSVSTWQLAARGKLADAFARLDECGADAELVALCKRCLASDPADRPADAGEVASLVAALRTAADERAKQAELDRVRAEGELAKAEAEAREQHKRRRAVQGAAGAVAAVLLLGIAGTTFGLIRADNRRVEAENARGEANAKRAEAEREALRAEAGEKLAGDRLVEVEAEKKKAEDEKRIAQAARGFLQNKLLRQAGPRSQADTLLRAGDSPADVMLNPPIRLLLDRAAAELAPDAIGNSFPGQPLVQAELLMTVGNTYRDLGEFGPAVAFLKRAADLRAEHRGPDHPDTLDALHNLARTYYVAGRRAEAIKLFQQVYDQRRAKLGATDPDTLATLHNLAVVYRAASNFPEAIKLFQQVHDAFAGRDKNDSRALTALDNLAWTHREAGRAKEAIPLHERVRDARLATLGPTHYETLETLNNLAEAYAADGQLPRAIELFEQVRRDREKVLGAEDRKTLSTLNGLAVAYYKAGRIPEATALFKQVCDLRVARLGPHHQNTLSAHANLAVVYRNGGMLAEAIALFEQIRGPTEVAFGPDHNTTLTLFANLAKAYWDDGRLADALPLFERAAGGMEKRQFQSPLARLIVQDTITAYEAAGQFEKAEGWRRKWLAFVRQQPNTDPLAYAGELAPLGLNLLNQKKWDAAEATLRECLAVREKQQPDAWTTFATVSLLGRALLGQKKYADAEPQLLRGYEGMKQRQEKIPSAGRVLLPEAIDRLIELYTATDRPAEATKWQAERATYPNIAPPPREKR